MKILLIEPNGLLGGLYQKLLMSAGHQVGLVQSGQQAIEECDAQAPDLILLEIQLPNQNGVAFLHELRSYKEWQCIPVILNTFVHPRNLPQFLRDRLGIAHYFYKPASNIEELQNVGDLL